MHISCYKFIAWRVPFEQGAASGIGLTTASSGRFSLGARCASVHSQTHESSHAFVQCIRVATLASSLQGMIAFPNCILLEFTLSLTTFYWSCLIGSVNNQCRVQWGAKWTVLTHVYSGRDSWPWPIYATSGNVKDSSDYFHALVRESAECDSDYRK